MIASTFAARNNDDTKTMHSFINDNQVLLIQDCSPYNNEIRTHLLLLLVVLTILTDGI